MRKSSLSFDMELELAGSSHISSLGEEWMGCHAHGENDVDITTVLEMLCLMTGEVSSESCTNMIAGGDVFFLCEKSVL